MSDVIKHKVGSLAFNDEVVVSCELDPDLSKDYFNRIVGMADGASKSSKDLAFGWLRSRIDDETANFAKVAAKMGFSDQATIFAFEDGSYKQVDVADGAITSAAVSAATAGMPALTAVYGGDAVSVETGAFRMQ